MSETEVKDLGTVDMQEYREARKAAPVVEEVVEETQEKPAVATEEKSKSKGGFQRKIDRLIKHSSTIEQERDAAIKRAEVAEAKANGKTVKEPPKAEGSPVRESYESDAEYFDALVDWKVDEKQRLAEEERGRKEAEAEHKKIVSSYNERVIEAKSRIEDWEEIVSAASIDIPPGVGQAILRMSNGPDVTYYLAQHPEICEEMMEMDSLVAIGRVWEISKEIKAEKKEESEETEEKEEEKTHVKAKVPAPIRPVGSGSTKTSTIPLDKAPLDVYRKDYERRTARSR